MKKNSAGTAAGGKMKVYLDNAATTKVDEKVVEAMEPYFTEKYGNASSIHLIGQEAKRALEEARHIIAKAIRARDDEIYFTGSGTEANNWALKGIVWQTGKKNIVTTKIEHDCVLNSCKWLEKQGCKVTYLDVDSEGFVNLDKLKDTITDDTAIVSVIHGNNEIGVIQDIERIGKICREKNVLFHTDACQSFTKTEIDVKKMNIDLMTLNAHKIHGPKGVGALFVRKGVKISPLLHGGGQESGLRSGTENVPGIIGFAEAVKLTSNKHIRYMNELRDYFISKILEIPHVKLNGAREKRLCNNINVSFGNIEGEAIGGYLDAYGISSSTGSACSSKSLEPSHVLLAIGLTPLEANSSIRLSLSRYTTKEQIDYTIEKLKNTVIKLRKISPFKI